MLILGVINSSIVLSKEGFIMHNLTLAKLHCFHFRCVITCSIVLSKEGFMILYNVTLVKSQVLHKLYL